MQGATPLNFCGEASARIARWLLFHAREQGFFSYAILGKEEWERVLLERGGASAEGVAEVENRPGTIGHGAVAGLSRAGTLRSRYQLDSGGAMLVVALRYAPDVEPEPAGARAARGLPPLPLAKEGLPVAIVGRFARGNWYAELLDRLSACAEATAKDMAGAGLPFFPKKHWHRFSNSRLPEKALAVAAGLGAIGRNSLLIAESTETEKENVSRKGFVGGTPPHGPRKAVPPDRQCGAEVAEIPHFSSAVVLGIMILPFDLELGPLTERCTARSTLSLCAACRGCVDVCPGHALRVADKPEFERGRCIQHYTSVAGTLPASIEAAWGQQLYGCDCCLEACRYFLPDSEAHAAKGRIGGAFDAASLAAMDDAALRAALKNSALDQRWIDAGALRRNADLVAKRGR